MGLRQPLCRSEVATPYEVSAESDVDGNVVDRTTFVLPTCYCPRNGTLKSIHHSRRMADVSSFDRSALESVVTS